MKPGERVYNNPRMYNDPKNMRTSRKNDFFNRGLFIKIPLFLRNQFIQRCAPPPQVHNSDRPSQPLYPLKKNINPRKKNINMDFNDAVLAVGFAGAAAGAAFILKEFKKTVAGLNNPIEPPIVLEPPVDPRVEPPKDSGDITPYKIFLMKVIEVLQDSCADPVESVKYIKGMIDVAKAADSRGNKGCLSHLIKQKNCIKDMDIFLNSYTIISGNTQIGKAMSTLFAEIKAYVMKDACPIHLCRNMTADIAKFEFSVETINKLLELTSERVRLECPEFYSFKFPKVVAYTKEDKEDWSKALPHMDDIADGSLKEIPIFAMLANTNNLTDGVKMGRPSKKIISEKDAKERRERISSLKFVTKTLLEKGYVVEEFEMFVGSVRNEDDVLEAKYVTIPKSLRAALFTDETDLLLNNTISSKVGINGITKSIYAEIQTIVGEDYKTKITHCVTGTFFNIFTIVVDVTATIGSLLYGELDIANRNTQLIEITPSIFGHQFNGKGCKGIKKEDVNDRSKLFVDLVTYSREKNCSAHGFFICSETTTHIADQELQAMKCAAEYNKYNIIPIAANAIGCVMYAKHDLELSDTKGEDSKVKFDRSKLDKGKLSVMHQIIDTAIDPHPKKQSLKSFFMYKYGVYWETRESLNARTVGEYADKIKKRDDLRDIREKDGLPRIAPDEPIVIHSSRMFDQAIDACTVLNGKKISVCEYRIKDGSYQNIMEKIHHVATTTSTLYPIMRETYTKNGETFQTDPIFRTAGFGRALFDRGTNVRSTNHKCILSHLFLNINVHYDAIIHAAGRICGNDYGRCKPVKCSDVCPDGDDCGDVEGRCRHDKCKHGLLEDGVEQVCPHMTKHLYGSEEVLDMHREALICRERFLDIARNDRVNGIRNLQTNIMKIKSFLSHVDNGGLTRAELIEGNCLEEYNEMSLFFTKVTGGNFKIEKQMTDVGDKCDKAGLVRKRSPEIDAPGCKRTKLSEVTEHGSGSGGFAGDVEMEVDMETVESDIGDIGEVNLTHESEFHALVNTLSSKVYSDKAWVAADVKGFKVTDSFKEYILGDCRNVSGIPVHYMDSESQKSKKSKSKKVPIPRTCLIVKTLDGEFVEAKTNGRKCRIREYYTEAATIHETKRLTDNKKVQNARDADVARAAAASAALGGGGSGSVPDVPNVTNMDPKFWKEYFFEIVKETGNRLKILRRVRPGFKDFLRFYAAQGDEFPVAFHGTPKFTRNDVCYVIRDDDDLGSDQMMCLRKGSEDALIEKYGFLCSLKRIDMDSVTDQKFLGTVVSTLKDEEGWMLNSEIVDALGYIGSDKGTKRSMMWNWYCSKGSYTSNYNSPGLYAKKSAGKRHYFKIVE